METSMNYRSNTTSLLSLTLVLGLLTTLGCSHSAASGASGSSMSSMAAPKPDPRVGLKAGLMDAQEAAWNMRVVSKTPPSEKFIGVTNSDMAFTGNYVIQGSYSGYQI